VTTFGTPPEGPQQPGAAPAESPAPQPVTAPAVGLAYAGFGIRVLAHLIDSLVLTVVFFVLAAATGGMLTTNSDTGLTTFNSAAGSLLIVVVLAYVVGFWGARGQTPGMMALNLHIVRARDGTPIDFGIAAIRYVGYVISSIPFGLGLLWAAFDPRKQGWHDKIAGTFVIRPVVP
jgi:uncharacterized RDD family membrane protein YckC